jgi:hypothetical protein
MNTKSNSVPHGWKGILEEEGATVLVREKNTESESSLVSHTNAKGWRKVWQPYACATDFWQRYSRIWWRDKVVAILTTAHRVLLVRTGIRRISNNHKEFLILGAVIACTADSECPDGGGLVSVADIFEYSSEIPSYLSRAEYVRCLAELEARGDVCVRTFDSVGQSGLWVDAKGKDYTPSNVLDEFSPRFTELRHGMWWYGNVFGYGDTKPKASGVSA